jgi:hypothetical protein
VRKALLLLGVVALTGSAQAGRAGLPPPVFTTSGGLAVLAASGTTAALATVGDGVCPIRLFRLDRRTAPVLVKKPNPCDPETEAFVDQLWLGRAMIAAEVYDSPSPHGEDFTYFAGPRPAGPLRARDEWGWQDSEEPYGYGCRRVVVSGGGLIVVARVPHRLGYDHGLEQDKLACPAGATSRIEVSGGSTPHFAVPGISAPLATDGKRVLLFGLDENGDRTGELSLVDLHGKALPAPAVAAAVARRSFHGWLTPDGLVLETAGGITGPSWTVKENGDVTVGEGRVVYVNRRVLHVRRIRDGVDRALFTLPPANVELAAGSFGVAITIATEERARLYRLPWKTIDRTLTALDRMGP